jgi:hypothetical protein
MTVCLGMPLHARCALNIVEKKYFFYNKSDLICIPPKNNVYLSCLIDIPMNHALIENGTQSTPLLGTLRHACLRVTSLCGNVLPGMALFAVPLLYGECYFDKLSFSKTVSMSLSFTQVLIWIVSAAVIVVIGDLHALSTAAILRLG